jgi:Calcium binding
MDDSEKIELTEDEAREERINMEIIVDAYGGDEQALGWYYYLEEHLGFPFRARCIEERLTSPLRTGDTIEVAAMAPEEECEQEMFVQIKWQERDLAVPLAQLEGVKVDKDTRQALADWHYWVRQGYEF